MTRVLITGMSGTGKSSVLAALADRGFRVVDTDYDGWQEWSVIDGVRDRVWREDRMDALLASAGGDLLFVAGTVPNQRRFYDRFEHVVLLSAPADVIVERLAARTNNPYGKRPDELAEVLANLEEIEPRLRRSASIEVDTTAPLREVVETILEHVR